MAQDGEVSPSAETLSWSPAWLLLTELEKRPLDDKVREATKAEPSMPKPKCPKCEARLGKRFCPALDTSICSRCCAEHRLKTIECPPDCPYLESEAYQAGRRRERALVAGKEFLDFMSKVTPPVENDPSYDFCMQVQADAYLFMSRSGGLSDGEAMRAYDGLRGLLGKIYVADGAPLPMTQYLHDRFENSERYKRWMMLSDRDRAGTLEDLVSMIKKIGKTDSDGYWNLVESFYKNVDLSSDFGFTENDYAALQGSSSDRIGDAFQRSEGGLILPSDS